MKSKYAFILTIWTVFCAIFAGSGCDMKDQLIGVYDAIEPANALDEKITIELMENGKGLWRRRNEEVPFSWYIKNEEIRINTKDGGTMVGKIKKKGITIILPGEQEITFKKIR